MSNCSRCGSSPLMCLCPAPDLSSHRQLKLKLGDAVAEPVEGLTPRPFPWDMLSFEDMALVLRYIGKLREPDLVIDSEQSGAYLFRWHVVPRNEAAGVYLHVQVASDPERPLHDHPWDNMSVILAGGYDEVVQPEPPNGDVFVRQLRKGGVAMRRAETAHRLILPDDIKYTISQFTMAFKRRKWGFWIDGAWYAYDQCCRFEGNRTFFTYPPGTTAPEDGDHP